MMNTNLEAAARQALEALDQIATYVGQYDLPGMPNHITTLATLHRDDLREALAEQAAESDRSGCAAGSDEECTNRHCATKCPALAEQQAAESNAVLVEGFGRVAMRKLNDLREKGYAVNGVAITTFSATGEIQRGAVTTGGMVLWWPQQPAQQAAEPVAYSIDKDQEGIRAKVCDAVSGALAYGALGLNPAPEGHWLEPFWKMARAERDSRDSTLQPKFWYDEEDAVLYGLNEDRPNGCILLCTPAPTQQPLTDEQKAVLRECRNKAMKWAAQAGIPECAAFGGMAQDLDWLCGQLGITGSKT